MDLGSCMQFSSCASPGAQVQYSPNQAEPGGQMGPTQQPLATHKLGNVREGMGGGWHHSRMTQHGGKQAWGWAGASLGGWGRGVGLQTREEVERIGAGRRGLEGRVWGVYPSRPSPIPHWCFAWQGKSCRGVLLQPGAWGREGWAPHNPLTSPPQGQLPAPNHSPGAGDPWQGGLAGSPCTHLPSAHH